MNLFLFVIIILLVFMTLIFALALQVKDNSIVDIAYGLAFVLVAWSAYLFYASGHARQQLLLGLITLWGLRLAVHIFIRKRSEEGEDSRYRQWRESWGKDFVWRSFLQIYLLQGTVIFLVTLPVLLVIAQPGRAISWIDLCGGADLVVWFCF